MQITGTFIHPNAFGFFLIMVFSVFLFQAMAQSGIRKLLAVWIVAASGVLLVATFARSAWIGAMVVLMVAGALRKHVFLVLAPVVTIIVIGMVPTISHRLADPFGGSFADRVGIWHATAPEWLSNTRDDAGALSTVVNRLIGTGPGSVVFLVQSGYGTLNAEHNDYLMALYEYGIIGLAAYLSIYLAILISAYRTWRQSTDERVSPIALSFIALILSFMVMSFTENIFGGTQNQIYFWTLAGLTAAISKLSVRPSGNPRPAEGANIALARNGRTSLYYK